MAFSGFSFNLGQAEKIITGIFGLSELHVTQTDRAYYFRSRHTCS